MLALRSEGYISKDDLVLKYALVGEAPQEYTHAILKWKRVLFNQVVGQCVQPNHPTRLCRILKRIFSPLQRTHLWSTFKTPRRSRCASP